MAQFFLAGKYPTYYYENDIISDCGGADYRMAARRVCLQCYGVDSRFAGHSHYLLVAGLHTKRLYRLSRFFLPLHISSVVFLLATVSHCSFLFVQLPLAEYYATLYAWMAPLANCLSRSVRLIGFSITVNLASAGISGVIG